MQGQEQQTPAVPPCLTDKNPPTSRMQSHSHALTLVTASQDTRKAHKHRQNRSASSNGTPLLHRFRTASAPLPRRFRTASASLPRRFRTASASLTDGGNAQRASFSRALVSPFDRPLLRRILSNAGSLWALCPPLSLTQRFIPVYNAFFYLSILF